MASPKEVVDLRAYGWDIEKAEDITLLPDKQTIAIVNDNDFSVAVSTGNAEKITDLTYDAVTTQSSLDGKIKTPLPTLHSRLTRKQNVKMSYGLQ